MELRTTTKDGRDPTLDTCANCHGVLEVFDRPGGVGFRCTACDRSWNYSFGSLWSAKAV